MENTLTFKDLMENETMQQKMDALTTAMEEDPVMMKLVNAAKTVEDMYEITKSFIKVTLDDFKKVFWKVADYFSADKAVISDDILDDVVGGWSFSSLFGSAYEKIKCIGGCIAGAALMLGGVALGVTMIVVGGPVGVAAGITVAAAALVGGADMIRENNTKLQTM